MKNNVETVKDWTTKDQTPKTQPAAAKEPAAKVKAPTSAEASAGRPKAKGEPTAKAAKVPEAAKAEADGEALDRLPATLDELKESKRWLVTVLFLSGKSKEEIAKELQATFKRMFRKFL